MKKHRLTLGNFYRSIHDSFHKFSGILNIEWLPSFVRLNFITKVSLTFECLNMVSVLTELIKIES